MILCSNATKTTHVLKRMITGYEKRDCLHQCDAIEALAETKWIFFNHFKNRSLFEGDALYLVGLEGHRLLRAHPEKSNIEFRQI